MKTLDAIDKLESATTSDVKNIGWPGITEKLRKKRAMVITSHKRRAVVMVDPDVYQELVNHKAGKDRKSSAKGGSVDRELSLARLQGEFDRRLAKLQDGKSLKAVLSKPAHRGKITVGSSF